MVFFLLCGFCVMAPHAGAATLSHGVVLGIPSATSIKFWARTDSAASVQVEYKLTSNSYPGTLTSSFNTTSGTDFTGTVTATGLTANTSYDYRVYVDSVLQVGNGSSGTFTTLKTAGTACSYDFAVTADFNATILNGGESMNFDDILAGTTPDFNVFLGDQIYGPSSGTQADIETYYKTNWAEVNFKTFTKSLASVFMWDDHELMTPATNTSNDWDVGKTETYSLARAAFNNYQSSSNPSTRLPHELYFNFTVCDTDFFMLDTRTFRTRDEGYDSNSNRMLGTAQMAHLKSWLKNSTAQFKFILSPTPWSDTVASLNDSYYSFKSERSDVFNFIKRNNIQNVIVLSADQHALMINKNTLGPTNNVYEFSPSPLHSNIKSVVVNGSDVVCRNTVNGNYFGLVTVDTTLGTPQINLKGYQFNDFPTTGFNTTPVCESTFTATSFQPTPATFSSGSNQTLTVGSGTTAINTMTITDASSTATITATNDIRIRIPTTLNMLWDTTDTTATIGGGASAKVSTTVSYEESGKVLVLNVTSNFSTSDSITVSGLSFVSFTGATKATALTLDAGNDGGGESTDSFTKTISASTAASVYSANNQVFAQGQSVQSIQAITVVDGQTPVVTSTNDIRITIPSGVPMTWDTTDTSASFSGSATAKASTTVSYENSNKTLVIDVTSNFAANDSLVISGLSFTSFSGTVAASSLTIDTNNDSSPDASDARTVRIVSSSTKVWTGLGESAYTSDPLNWSGQSVPTSGQAVVFDSTRTEDIVVDYIAQNLASWTLDTGFTNRVTVTPYAFNDTLGVMTLSGALTVTSGTLVFQNNQHVDGDLSTIANDGTGYIVTASNVTVGASGIISLNGEGFSQGLGQGTVAGSTSGATGGSYGGRGGFDSAFAFTPAVTYGSAASPLSLGSGGSYGSNCTSGCPADANGSGGSGGGALKVVASSVSINGTLSANGEDVAAGYDATKFRYAGGSGGSIWIASGTLSGSGTISARGGNIPTNTDTSTSGAGGGGRISFNGATYSFTGTVTTAGGTVTNSSTTIGTRGMAGSIYFPSATLSDFTLTGNITMGNDIMQTFGTLTVPNGYTLTLDGDYVAGTGYTLTATTLNVNSGGFILTDELGYPAGYSAAAGMGATGSSSSRAAGGGYGGRGGSTALTYSGTGGTKYGSASAPVSLGSGSGRVKGGAGAGALKFIVSGVSTIAGTISANGGIATSSVERGGGSGGSIWFSSGTVSGAGTIRANGGDGNSTGGAGGGGRVSFNGATYSFTGTLQVNGGTVTSTTGGHAGYTGTVYFPTQYPSSTFTLSNALKLGNDISYTFGNLTIASGGTLTLDSDPQGNSNLGTGGTINATTLTIANGGTLTATAMGHHDTDTTTTGRGAACSGNRFNGAGHGGQGGQGQTTSSPLCPAISAGNSQSYGSSTSPTTIGAGHLLGTTATSSYAATVRGGGAIKLNITDTLTVNGTLSANGEIGTAGGSIWVVTKKYAGSTGVITANGGNGGSGAIAGAASGGGGRIRIESVSSTYSGAAPSAAAGTGTTGTGSSDGSAGTISSQTLSDTTAPTASHIQVSSITATGATITWDTDEEGSSQVEYGTSVSYGTSTTETDISTRVISHTVNLSGLTGSTTYHFRVKSKDDAGTPNEGISSDQTFTTTAAPDTTAPVISNIVATPTHNSVQITWDTDEAASSIVDYGPTASYGTSTSEADTSPRVTSHSVTINSLSSSTTYHFRVKSNDAASNVGTSTDQTFTTTAAPDVTPPVISNIVATPTYNSVTITWDTDEIASSIVDYGPTTSYGTSTTEADTSPRVTSHSVTINSLTPSTLYHFRVQSNDASSNLATGSDQTFTTSAAPVSGGAPGGAVIIIPTPPTNIQTPQNPGASVDTIGQKILAGYYKAGISKDEIKALQTYLNTKINAGLTVDGLFGKLSQAAIEKWKNTRTQSETPTNTETYTFKGYFKRGAKNAEIKEIQKYLNKALDLTLDVDGIFGKGTEAALIEFQKEHKISPAAGTFGAITRAYFNSHPL